MANNNRVIAKDIVVINELGLHARSAAKIAELAKNAKSKVWVQKDNEKVDAKSIIDILTLACEKGSKIQIIVEDASDKTVLDSIVRLAVNGFGE
jgi:phosphocarrier protein HPr